MIKDILIYGDERLFEKSEDVAAMGSEEKAILDDLWDTMLHNRCIGLSAPQIGVLKRLFVVNAGGVCIRGANPKILSCGALTEDLEGSPCLLGVQRPVRRPKKILCEYTDENGEHVECELKGIAARVFCHETDHHDGILFIDQLKPIQKKLALKEFEQKNNK